MQYLSIKKKKKKEINRININNCDDKFNFS